MLQSNTSLVLALQALFFLPGHLFTSSTQQTPPTASDSPVSVVWQSNSAEHAFGFPDTKPRKSGILTLEATALNFKTKTSKTSIPLNTITAVNAGNDRVELWGTGGRIMRMAIPNGGGLAVAAFMHHRVDMLSVEFRDTRGGMHSAVFYLPAKEAEHALQSFSKDSFAETVNEPTECAGNPVEPNSVLVEMPDWNKIEVPAAYRSLVYEHVIERMKTNKEIGHVYRYGEIGKATACPQRTIKIAIETYKKGNQVVRASTGPIGMFTSATQMTFSVTYLDAHGETIKTDRIKAAVRTESESTGIADSVAKKLTKQYTALVRNAGQEPPAPVVAKQS